MSQEGTPQLSEDFQQNMNVSTTPPQSEFESMLTQLNKNPHQPTRWKRLLDIAQSSGATDKIKTAHEALLQQYPNTAAAQISYIEHYLNENPQHTEAVELFKRFVKPAPSVELVRFYLNYIRRIHVDPSRRDLTKREIIRKAYEYALNPPNGIGQDRDSGDIWSDYIQFLSEADTSTTSTWEKQQNMDVLRKVYQRAVQIPLDNVERLWSDYEAFESKQNKITAKKFMSDLSPAHIQAKTALRQLCSHVNGLYPPGTGLPELYLPSLPTFTGEDRALIGKWKAYLKWEESNPLEIEEKDKPLLILRIQTVYRKALIRMRFYSEIWFMAYSWTKTYGKQEDAIALLVNGREANPTSHLLTYAYVDAQELLKKYDDVENTYEEFLVRLRAELEEMEERIKAGTADDPTAMDTSADGQNTQAQDQSIAENQELNDKKQEYTLVYINYMRFVKRSKTAMEARPIFRKARLDKWVTWHAYEAAAMLEYHTQEDKTIPGKIFAAAYTKFSSDVLFVQRYMQYLFSVDDEQNARAVFEASASHFPPDVARPIWERWAKYEYQYGDLEAALKLEKRMADIYPSDPPIKRFAMRYTHQAIDAIASRDIGFAVVRKTNSSGTPAQPSSNGPSQTAGQKRPPSPDRRREDHNTNTFKRPRAASPPRERERERWNTRTRYSSPPKDRERAPFPRRDRDRDMQPKEEDVKPIILPPVLSQFLGQLPPSSVFDGPVFRVDDLMSLFKNAIIPSTGGVGPPPPQRVRSPPPPPRSGGRPPPDYGPYQGPGGRGGGGGGRRY